MKIVLFGGSNSILHCGIKTGIASVSDVNLLNFSLGASSSLQNLDALIANKHQVLDADLIVSESNVNDSYNAKYLEADIDIIFRNIKLYYRELNKFGIPVCVVLYPVNHKLTGAIESKELATEINAFHINMCKKFGFYIVDLAFFINGLKDDVLNALMPDSRHPKPLFMHDMGANIIRYFSINKKPDTSVCNCVDGIGSDYIRISADEVDSNKVEKKENSIFKSNVVRFVEKYYFPEEYIGFYLIGVGTWGSENSFPLKLSNKNKIIVKSFNKDKAYNEILEEFAIDDCSFAMIDDAKQTERSINVPSKASPYGDLYIESFLLCKSSETINDLEGEAWESKNSTALDITGEVLPEYPRYVFDSNYDIKNYEKRLKGVSSSEDIQKIVNIAVSIEKLSVERAMELMLIASKYSRFDDFVKNKIIEYRSSISTDI